VPEFWEPELVAPISAASGHLRDSELLSSESTARDKHLADCEWCRQRLLSADAMPGFASDEAFEQALAVGEWRVTFSQASSNAVIPDGVRDLMTAPASVGDAEPGQLWRVSWHDERLLVAVIDTQGWLALVAPVTTDVSLADELTLRVPAERSPLGTELAVWVRSRMRVPLFVFDRPLGALPSVGANLLPAVVALRHLVRMHLTESQVPQDLPVGRQLTDNDTDRLAIHDALREQLSLFAAAPAGLLEDASLIIGEKSGDARELTRPMPDVLRELAKSKSLSELADMTGLEMSRLLDLSRLGAIAEPDEVAAIERVAGVGIDDSTWFANAAAALAEVSRPTWRSARRRWTQGRHPEADPDDPTLLASDMLRWTLAARSLAAPEPATEDDRLQRFWRDQVVMMLQEYR
jgi:hypothetical protein